MSAPASELPTVVIVGRPNVGKSTLFNRLIGKRKAITLDTPGVTRDPIAETVEWSERRLRLVDTGGLGGEDVIDLAERVHDHTLRTIEGAAAAIVVFDARDGVGPLDRDTVAIVQRMRIPALYVANKADGPAQIESLGEFCRLGIDPPLPLSAEHDVGFGALKDATVELLAADDARGPQAGASETGPDARLVRVAIVGRPNVGKSSLLNSVAGASLALVDERPGTTRDIVDTHIERAGKGYLLLDTAGMRRPSRVDTGIERISVGRSVSAIRRADVVLVMIEPEEGMTDQDARIARLAWQEGKALVIGLNKIDTLDRNQKFDDLHRETLRRYPTLAPALMTFLSALERRGIDELFEAIDRAAEAREIEMRTTDINRIVASAAERRQPPVVAGRRLKILYAAQTNRRPPAVTLFVNRIGVPTDYARFLERCFREALPLEGTPLRLHFSRRASHGPDRE